jgi:virginiamycin A acetyltransferase
MSVVTADVPPYTVAGGNPAGVIRTRFPEETISRLLRIAWWDWPIKVISDNVRVLMTGSVDQIEAVALKQGLLEGEDSL